MTSHVPIEVLIATLASRERAAYLVRALASLRDQGCVDARPIVIVNGSVADPELVRPLERTPGLTLVQLPEPSLPLSMAAGRRLGFRR